MLSRTENTIPQISLSLCKSRKTVTSTGPNCLEAVNQISVQYAACLAAQKSVESFFPRYFYSRISCLSQKTNKWKKSMLLCRWEWLTVDGAQESLTILHSVMIFFIQQLLLQKETNLPPANLHISVTTLTVKQLLTVWYTDFLNMDITRHVIISLLPLLLWIKGK